MKPVFCLSLCLLAGCVQLVPLDGVAPTPGKTVQMDLNEPIEFQVVGALLQNLNRIEGTYLANSADSLIVTADYLWSVAGAKHRGYGARLAIPRQRVEALQERRVSAWRTAVLAGAGVGALGLVIFSVEQLVGGDGGNGGPGPGPRPQ